MRADTADVAEWDVPEFQCRPHVVPYIWRAAGGARIIKEIDPVSRKLVAYHVNFVRSLDRIVYMDGRPHPPEYAAHTWEGFSTGEWDGNTLVITTTHHKEGYLRRNNVMYTDKAKVTEWWTRHGDIFTVAAMIDDPIYLEEPWMFSISYKLNIHSRNRSRSEPGHQDRSLCRYSWSPCRGVVALISVSSTSAGWIQRRGCDSSGRGRGKQRDRMEPG